MKKVVVHNVRAIPFFESVNECVNDRAFYELRERHTHRSFGLSGTPSLAADNSSRNRMGMPSSTGACDASSEKNLKTRLPEKNFGQKMQVVVHDVRAIFCRKMQVVVHDVRAIPRENAKECRSYAKPETFSFSTRCSKCNPPLFFTQEDSREKILAYELH